jgi:hypothetical protein
LISYVEGGSRERGIATIRARDLGSSLDAHIVGCFLLARLAL